MERARLAVPELEQEWEDLSGRLNLQAPKANPTERIPRGHTLILSLSIGTLLRCEPNGAPTRRKCPTIHRSQGRLPPRMADRNVQPESSGRGSLNRSAMKVRPETITCRAARDEDRAFAYEVKKAALRAYVEPVWGWDENVQIEFHRRDWELRRPEIIQHRNRDIGTVEIWRRAHDIHLGEFYLLPAMQRQGIGTHLMRLLTIEADNKVVPIRLEVLRNNPVQSLYRRFGFYVSDETKTHFQMERAPNQLAQPTRPTGG